ncbi:MAG: thiamine-phosphate kinase [Dehalococcoidia bacterium]|nr:MAG: thiamine-phosphate kinase [Dehalococcoidia bacterium]
MKVSELGEFGLIDLLAKMVSSSQSKQSAPYQQLILGIGDDAAAWHGEAGTQLVTTDSLFQDIHFTLKTTPWYELGWKALAVNVSDIAAMGGVPRYALVSLALPEDTEVDDVTALYKGMIELAQPFEVAIIGGDTSRAPLVSITITVLGSMKNLDGHILTRSAARPGDKIAVTGSLGTAAAGLAMLTNQLQFDPEATEELKNAFLRPWPRVTEGQLLVTQGVKTAIDISDGLISDLNHICKSSQVGARVEVDRVPISPAVKANFGARALELALSGGEDYELLFTASAEVIDRVKEAASCPVTVVGEIIADKIGEVTLVDTNGNPFQLRKTGWEHFKAR